MSKKFDQIIAKMPKLLKELESKPFLTRDKLAGIPQKGVYVFYQKNEPAYVGRSNNLKERIQQHSRPSSNHYSATLAFNIAKEKVNYKRNEHRLATRDDLEKAPGFEKAFFLARKQVAEMQIHVVEIHGQIEQAIFEIYAHLILNTRYNDFSTH